MTDTSAYITAMGAFLPGEPIDNNQMEDYLGAVHGKPSRLRRRILKSNGILNRYYALDQEQKTTYQNSELAANAIEACLQRATFDKRSVGMLSVASTQGDLPLPGMASIVQAALRLPPVEILTTHGVCSSGIMALKSAANSIKLGDHDTAIVCASELSSRLLKASRYESVDADVLDFEAEFLRWMLSDGAGAMAVQSKPASAGLSLKIEWIDIKSYAADFDLCMSCGTSDQRQWTARSASEFFPSAGSARSGFNSGALENASRGGGVSSATLLRTPCADAEMHGVRDVRFDARADALLDTRVGARQGGRVFPDAISWQDYSTYAEAEKNGALLIRQNLRVLEAIVRVGVEGFLNLIQAGKIATSEIDHFVCHYSSNFFRGEILNTFNLLGCDVPESKWFSNLTTKGNTGAAAIFIALEELLYSGKLEPGQTVFCVVPESGRFCTAYMKLRVVEGAQ